MNKSSFFIVGQHAVIEALRNPKRKVLRVFLTEESKKNIHRKSPKQNLLNEVKVYFKTKKESFDLVTAPIVENMKKRGGGILDIQLVDKTRTHLAKSCRFN